MNPLDRIRIYIELAVAAAIVGLLWYVYHKGHVDGWDERDVIAVKEKAAQDAQSVKIATDALDVTKGLQASADAERKAKNAQVAVANANTAAAIAGMSNRPSRSDASSVPRNPVSGPDTSGTGAGLFREDSVFLTREAARAMRVRADLAECQRLYKNARDKLK